MTVFPRIAGRSRALVLALFALLLLVTALLPDLAEAANTNPRRGSYQEPTVDEMSSSLALILYDYSMGTTVGDNANNSCLTCAFMSYFMLALAEFSYTLYSFFFEMFRVIAPVAMAAWLGFRTIKLMVTGGEDGKGFLYGVVGKLALFCMVWIAAFGTPSSKNFLWQTTGPVYLDYAFGLSGAVRGAALRTLGDDIDALHCSDTYIPPARTSVARQDYSPSGVSGEFVAKAIEAGCFTERVHVMGMATGIAIALNSYGGVDLGPFDIGRIVSLFLTAIIKILFGLIIITVYGLSALWLIFLALDVVSRSFVMAGFSPILVLMSLFKPTRSSAMEAIKGLVGSLVTAVSIAVVAVLGYVLITNTANLYDHTYADVKLGFDLYENVDWYPISDNSSARLAMREFLQRLTLSQSSHGVIPMDFGTPWFWYILFCGAAIFALGKKMISLLEQLAGYQGESTFADSATKAIKTGAGAAIMGAGATAVVGAKAWGLSSKTITAGGGAIKGAASQSGHGFMRTAGGAWGGAQAALGRGKGSTKNVFANSALGEDAAPRKGRSEGLVNSAMQAGKDMVNNNIEDQ